MSNLPAISGAKLTKLLRKVGWEHFRDSRHGAALRKREDGRYRITVVPNTTRSLPTGTLHGILGSKQTKIGSKGLVALVRKYG